MMFAELESVPAEWIKNFVLIIAGLMAVGYYIKEIFFSSSKRDVQMQQPFQIEMSKKFADKHDFDKFAEENRREHENIFSKIGGVDRGTGAKISAEVTAIHTRINLLDKSNGRLEAATEFQNQQLAQMDSKITRLLERK